MDENEAIESMAGLPEGLGLPDVPDHLEGSDLPGVPDISPERLLELMEQFKSLSPEDRASLTKDLLGRIVPPPTLWQSLLNSQMFILFLFLLMVAGIFTFFGYKIYQSQVEKERKREEKKKLKQMKKKK